MTRISLSIFIGAVLVAQAARSPATEVDFVPVTDFVKLPADLALGPCSAVSVSRKGEIYLFHRGKRPVVVLDGAGNFVRAWGDDVITNPNGAHGLRIDGDDNVWVTDIVAHRAYRFSPAGKLLLSLGTGKPGEGNDEFNKPTDIAFGPRGDIFISDGYVNSRVMKFTSEGRFVRSWGTRGKGAGEFHLPHSAIVDARSRVIIGDRENDRIQIFDQDGKLLETWPGFAPYGLALDAGGALFVADARASRVLKLDEKGKVSRHWGEKGSGPGQFESPHMLSFDAVGNLYVAEVGNKRLQKLVKKSP